jgi:hypothetical protein
MSDGPVDSAEALYERGNRLLAGGELQLCMDCYRQAVALRPDFAEAHSNLGVALRRAGAVEEAIAAFSRALQLRPDAAEIHNNLGNCFFGRREIQEATTHYRAALAVNPEHAGAHWNLALVLFLQGDWDRGWEEFEWRWRIASAGLPAMKFQQPRWDGGDLTGKRLLLYSEQGLGDTIQFARFAPEIARRGGRIMLAVQRELTALLRQIEGVEEIVAKTDPLPEFDVHYPLMSLPLALKTTEQTIPAKIPYLQADAKLAARWKDRVPADGRKKVGLAWAGRPGYSQDRQRSFSLSTLLPLGDVPNTWFCSLQKGEAARQTTGAEIPLADWTGELNDLAETAGLIENLDLVICADTVVAHLAGAMGKPTWVLLPFAADWRWGLERGDSRWYSTMRLFRQTRLDDWTEPIEQVREALGDL